MITVGYLKKRLEELRNDDVVYAYEGGTVGLVFQNVKGEQIMLIPAKEGHPPEDGVEDGAEWHRYGL
jgi:hypothetical protein